MKSFRPLPLAVSLSVVLASGWLPAATAADQTYDPTSINGNRWDLSTLNWDLSVNPWINANNAIFGGAGELVDVDAAIIVGNITFGSTGYTIADSENNGTLSFGDPTVITVTNAADVATISEGIIAGGITKSGNGALVLSGASTFSGATTVSAGTLRVSSNTALGNTVGATTVATTGTLVLTNGVTVTGETLNLAGSGVNFVGALQAAAGASATWAGTIRLDAGARVGAQNGGVLTLSGVIQNGADSILSIGRETSAGTSGVVIVSGTSNTYTGVTNIVRGVLKIGANNALPTGTIVDVDTTTADEDSTFDLNGFNQTVSLIRRSGAGSGLGGSFVTNTGTAPSVLTVTGAGTYAGVIRDGSGVIGLTRSGTGIFTLAGANAYTGATTLLGGNLNLTGSLSGTAITISGGSFTEDATGVIDGASSIQISAGTASLAGANAYTGVTAVSGTAIVTVTHNSALGSTSGVTTVGAGSRLELGNNITITGETATINGSGDNNNGAIQAGANATATWAGNIIVGSSGARLGTQGNATLTVSGVISGATNLDISATAGTGVVVLSGANTWGVTSGTLSKSNIVRGTLRLGASGAIPDLVILDVHSAATPDAAVFDLNGFSETIAGLARGSTLGTGTVTNSSATTATLTLGNSVAGNDTTFSGVIENGSSSVSLAKSGTSIQSLTGINTYTGTTTVNAGTLQVSGAAGALASTAFTLNGGSFSINNAGASSNNTNRIANTAAFTFKGGALVFTGSDQAASNSSETVGDFILSSGISRITASYGATNSATLTGGQFVRTANSGVALVNGVGLGKDTASTASVARIKLTTAPTLVGTTAALGTGINVAAKNTQIVPYLLGEATATTGGLGTASGTANTFVTYEAGTGLRPLNLTDEFTQNAFTAGNNTRLTTTTNVATSVAINSLILEGASATITGGQTLGVTSGAILFSSGSNLGITGGTLDFGTREGIVSIFTAGNTSIDSLITGSGGITYSGSGSALLVLRGQNTYTGDTLLQVNTAATSNSAGPAGAPTSGAFGRGTLILGGGSIRSTAGAPLTIGNTVSFAVDTTVATAGAVDNNLTFTGPVTLAGGSRTLTQLSKGITTFSGGIGDGGNGFGLTITGAGAGPVVLSGTNSYTGATAIKAATVVVNGSLSGSSAVVVGDTANLSASAILGGSGTVGAVTVGAAAGNSGATLQPHVGSSSTSTGVTLNTGAVTFTDSAAKLSLQIGRSAAFTGALGSGAAGGDVSDHVSASGAVTLNGADLRLSLLTTTGYNFVNNDVFFLIINGGGGPINGTFGALNGVATTLTEGSHFTLGAQEFVITYQGSYATNAFTGGQDAAIMAVVPEPSVWLSLSGGVGGLLGLQRFRRRRRL